MTESSNPSRRDFLRISSACAAHIAFMATPFPLAAREGWSRRSRHQVVAQEPFGRLEAVGEGLWGFVSTPLGGDYTTVCNGGIISGEAGVLVVEAFQTPEGSRWMAEKALELTGRWPTHVVVTHYHGDHSSGVAGFHGADHPGPGLHVTPTTQALKEGGFSEETSSEVRHHWADVVLLGEDAPETLDLGGRVLTLTPRLGHTASDVTIALEEEGITWCGDLVWNGMFPNYMDATPSLLSRAVRRIQTGGSGLFVPGHGPLAGSVEMANYVSVIDGIEETARAAWAEGWTSDEAAARHTIPESLGEWTLFNPSYFQRAVEAWMKEWEAQTDSREGS